MTKAQIIQLIDAMDSINHDTKELAMAIAEYWAKSPTNQRFTPMRFLSVLYAYARHYKRNNLTQEQWQMYALVRALDELITKSPSTI